MRKTLGRTSISSPISSERDNSLLLHSFQVTTLAAHPTGIYSGHFLNPSFQSHQISCISKNDICAHHNKILSRPPHFVPTQVAHWPNLAGLGLSFLPQGEGAKGVFSPGAQTVSLSIPCPATASSGCGQSDESNMVLPDGLDPTHKLWAPGDFAYSLSPSDDFEAHSPIGNPGCLGVFEVDTFGLGAGPADICPFEAPNLPRHQSLPLEPLIGLFADFNMREILINQDSPPLTINPAIIMGREYAGDNVLRADSPTNQASSPPPSIVESGGEPDLTEAAVNAIVSVLSASLVEKNNTSACRSLTVDTLVSEHSNDHGFPIPVLPTRSVTTPIPSAEGPTLPERKFDAIPESALCARRNPFTDITASTLVNAPAPSDAHLGIDLGDLRAKAEEYRTRNPGRDIDKAWLQSFAGKLSEDGERLQEYRCYVKDCCQTNKRRDHILVHVGSHVEFRPFHCDYCGMKFLRKNECKRHMSSHGGQKPFTCSLCAPYQEKSFVRQDLLKRHIKVTHGVYSGDQDRRKRIKLGGNENENTFKFE